MKRNIIILFICLLVCELMGCRDNKVDIKSKNSSLYEDSKNINYSKRLNFGYDEEKNTIFISFDKLVQNNDLQLAEFDITESTLVSIECKMKNDNNMEIVLQGENEEWDLTSSISEKITLDNGNYKIIAKGIGEIKDLNLTINGISKKIVENIEFAQLNDLGELPLGNMEILEDLPQIKDPTDEVLQKIFGDILPQEYSMEYIKGNIDNDSFMCDYKTKLEDFKNNYIILAQLDGNNSNRNIEYDIKSDNGKCQLILDNENGTAIIVDEGETISGVKTIRLEDGANCLRLVNDSEKCNVIVSIKVD